MYSGNSSLGFTSEQMKKLLSLINESPSSSIQANMAVCHRAKQTIEPFPLSDHKSKTLGELVHLDLWGPYRVPSREGGIHLRFWSDCVLTAVYLINRLPSSVLNENTSEVDHLKFYDNKNIQSPNDDGKDTLVMDGNLQPFTDTANFAQASGEVERYKARLVAKGFGQREGFNYNETFSHVVKMVTVRCLINIAICDSWPLYQLDVNNDFLYGDLKEDVYMTLPEGYKSNNKHKVCKLNKSLYGLKQAPRQWNAKLTTALIEHGFEQSKFDYSLYVKKKGALFVALLVYVDDILITGTSVVSCKSKKHATLSRSSAEAEYRSLASTTCEIIWLRNLLHSLGLKNLYPVPLFYNNSSSIQIAANPMFHEKTKHFELDVHIVREKVNLDLFDIGNNKLKKSQGKQVALEGRGTFLQGFKCK
ncbi:ribonuclease H-like domain-containing protein [Tanacetum coccineum]